MIRSSLRWYGDQARVEIRARSWRGLRRAILYLWERCREAVSVPNPRPYTTPSRPGEPPRLRTGRGRSAITYELDETTLTGQVGLTNAGAHLAYLERGTRRVEPRPWLLATAQKHLQALRQLISS